MNKAIKRIKINKKMIPSATIIAGIILIVISFLPTSTVGKDEIHQDELESYTARLENRLCKTLNCITDEDCFSVMITLKGSFENVYSDTNGTYENSSRGITPVFSDSNNDTTPVIIKRKNPEIAGVVIASKSPLSAESSECVKQAASTVLNISKSKIYVITGGYNQ